MGCGCGTFLILVGVVVAFATGNPVFIIIVAVMAGGAYAYNAAVNQGSLSTPGRSIHGPYAPGDGPGFERFVQQRLSRTGYSVRNTGASSDYGVDLIATRFGRKIAIQTKNYAKPVGVKAVQEVNAGKAYHRADEAWVVSRSGFTQQAKALARATDVKLVDVNTL